MIKPRAVIYIRVSDPTQVENNSLETQEKACRRYCEAKGYEVVEPIFRDEGISAKNFQKREGVKKLLLFCTLKRNNIQKVIVYKMDRWTRNVEEGLAAISLLAKYCVFLESVTEETSETAIGKAMRTIMMTLGQLDNDMKSERVKDNLLTMFNKGLWCWKPPIGYKRPEGSKEDRKGKVCEIDNNLGPIIKTIFTEASKGTKKKVKLAQIANALGFGKYNGKDADCNLISKIVKKTFYYGYMYAPKWKKYQWGVHEPIIKEDIWRKANINLFGNRSAYQIQDLELYPLKGLIRCGECGHILTTSNPRGKFRYYECKQKKCIKQQRLLADKAEKQFIVLLQSIKPSELVMKLFNHLVFSEWDTTIESQKQKIIQYDSKISALEDEISYHSISSAKGILKEEEANKLIEKARVDIAILKMERGDIKIEKYDSEITRNFTEAFINNLDRLWIKFNLTKKQLFQNKVFPKGIICQNMIIRTDTLSPSFEYIKQLKQQNSLSVTPRRIELRLAE